MNEHDLLLAYRPWLRAVSQRMCGGGLHGRAEELAAEGWIEMWLGFRSHDRDKAPADYWLKRLALQKMQTIVRDWTAQRRDAHRLSLVGDLSEVWEGAAAAHEIDLAYHEGELLAALNALTPREREYVALRFWGGYRLPDLREHFGYDPSALWRTAKAKLRVSLAHLASIG